MPTLFTKKYDVFDYIYNQKKRTSNEVLFNNG